MSQPRQFQEQHLSQQKLQKQLQLLLGSDAFSQAQLSSDPGTRVKPEPENRNEALHSQISAVKLYMLNQYQQLNLEDRSKELQAQWYPKSRDGSEIPGSSSEPNAQELHQRTSTQEEAQPNNLSGNCRRYLNQQRWLLFLSHARRCYALEGRCPENNCIHAKNMLRHLEGCSTFECQYPRCAATKVLINHYKRCRDVKCPVCIPLKRQVAAERYRRVRR